jgi:hypothetical protein
MDSISSYDQRGLLPRLTPAVILLFQLHLTKKDRLWNYIAKNASNSIHSEKILNLYNIDKLISHKSKSYIEEVRLKGGPSSTMC